MDTLDIHLRVSGELKARIERAVASGDYESTEACAGELLEDAAAGLDGERERLIAALAEGLDSGPSVPLDEKEWQSIRDELQARRESRRRNPE